MVSPSGLQSRLMSDLGCKPRLKPLGVYTVENEREPMTETTDHKTCKSRWAEHKNNRFADLRALLKYDNEGQEHPELGSLNEYGLSLDYVAPGTFNGQKRGYWRYQLSWGGPSDEIRLYGEMVNDYRIAVDRITYVFQDWFDGYERKLAGRDLQTAETLVESWAECGTLSHLRNEALKDE